jgi:hypothetical protein
MMCGNWFSKGYATLVRVILFYNLKQRFVGRAMQLIDRQRQLMDH